ncbi:MAG: preprotein translocase subunit SecG [Muribaculaceae bacterium]|nr:preprotein translocase subunit SecG [Bacteroidales bacterium]MDE6039962.1 preprotein translocase subunit SecG [Muribaculaceae bacterium]
MYTIVIVLTVIVAILLIGIVLIQKSKGGGLSSQFGGAGAVMGVRQTNNFLEKTTWTLIACLFVLSVISAFTMPRNNGGTQLRTQPVEAPATVEFPAGQFDSPVTIPADAPAETPAEATETPAAE